MDINTQNITDTEDKPLIRADVEKLLREVGSPEMLNLSGRNLNGINLSEFNLAKVNLSGTNLGGANLREAILSQANLRQADLRQADLVRTNLSGADLHGANLKGATIGLADLSRADLSNAYLLGSTLGRTNLHEANLREATLSYASLNDADLSGADLRGAILDNARLFRANLSGADLRGVDLSNVDLVGANLAGAYVSEFEKEQLHDRSILDLNAQITESASAFRIRVVEEPLTAYNLTMIISALTELYTECWLIHQDRFAELIEYAQTRDVRFTREANLVIGRFTYNSPALIELLLNPATLAATATVALALKTAIDAVVQAPLRYKATQIEIRKKELEMKLQKQGAHQTQQMIAQKTELERQKIQLELDRQQLELEQQQLELDRQRLELEKNRVEVARETASRMVDILRPGIDMQTKGMLVQPLLPGLLQLSTTEGLELVDDENEEPKEGNQPEED